MTGAAALTTAAASCSSTSNDAAGGASEVDASTRRDGDPVEPAEGGAADAGIPPGPAPECPKYCDSVLDSCKGSNVQYASRSECLAFCARLPPGRAGANEGNSVACRQFFAGSPARTDSLAFCAAAGPFGGGVCGDRCPNFCELALGACPATGDAAAVPYMTYPDCQTACLGFPYKDGGVDGGGETTSGPKDGNTLNCRLYYLREAVLLGTGCENVGATSDRCK